MGAPLGLAPSGAPRPGAPGRPRARAARRPGPRARRPARAARRRGAGGVPTLAALGTPGGDGWRLPSEGRRGGPRLPADTHARAPESPALTTPRPRSLPPAGAGPSSRGGGVLPRRALERRSAAWRGRGRVPPWSLSGGAGGASRGPRGGRHAREGGAPWATTNMKLVVRQSRARGRGPGPWRPARL
jgi:hypothetical protein